MANIKKGNKSCRLFSGVFKFLTFFSKKVLQEYSYVYTVEEVTILEALKKGVLGRAPSNYKQMRYWGQRPQNSFQKRKTAYWEHSQIA